MKGLVRDVVARRFPALGFDRQKKVEIKELFLSIMVKEAPKLWREMGGAKALSALGLVDSDRLNAQFLTTIDMSTGTYLKACKLFDTMNLESWSRKRL